MALRAIATVGLVLTFVGGLLVFISTPTIGPGYAVYAPEPRSPEWNAAQARAAAHAAQARWGFLLIGLGAMLQVVVLWAPGAGRRSATG